MTQVAPMQSSVGGEGRGRSMRILSIDDNPQNQRLMSGYLSSRHECLLAMSGPEGLEQADANQPEVILLDVDMPGMDGYEVCRQIRQHPALKTTPVLFVSALDSVENKIRGYESGGDDYITKPVNFEELELKLQALREYRELIAKLETDLQSTTETLLSALTNSSELGVLIQFMEASFHCRDYEGLATAVSVALQEYGLCGSMQFRTGRDDLNFSCNSAISPLESELLREGRHGDRIHSFGRRTLFNAPRLTLLVKNMPVDNDELYGRIKDHLAILLTAAEAKLQYFIREDEIAQVRDARVDDTLASTYHELTAVEEEVSQFEKRFNELMDHLLLDVESEMVAMMLNEEQEQIFVELIEKYRGRMDDMSQVGARLDTCFEQLSQRLRHILH